MESKEKMSNIELLKILAIFMVITSHFCVHGGYDNLNFINLNFNRYLVQILRIGTIANHIFIIITGYFMINKKIKVEKIVKLILEMFVYSILIYFIFYILNIDNIRNSGVKTLIKNVLPIFWGNWFIIYYIILYLLSPFLNFLLKSLSKEKTQHLIIILFLLLFCIPTFTRNAWAFTGHDLFIFDYIIGAYIKLYMNKIKKKINFYLFLSIICYIFVTFLILIIGMLLKNNIILGQISYVISVNYSLFSIIIAVLLFMSSLNWKIKENKYINYFSSSILGIYLIHDNSLVRKYIWTTLWKNDLYINSCFFIFYLIAKVLLVFIVCFSIDKIRIKIFKKFNEKIEHKITDRINKKYNNIKKILMINKVSVKYL